MIIYTPKAASEHWEWKCAMEFDSLHSMAAFIAEKANVYYRYIGIPSDFAPEDVVLTFGSHRGTVSLGGNIIGHCWE